MTLAELTVATPTEPGELCLTQIMVPDPLRSDAFSVGALRPRWCADNPPDLGEANRKINTPVDAPETPAAGSEANAIRRRISDRSRSGH